MAFKMPFFRVLYSYSISLRRMKWFFLSVFFVYGLGSLASGVFVPLIYRQIIENISGTSDRGELLSVLMGNLLMLAGATFFYQICYRIGDFLVVFSKSRTMEDLNRRVFQVFMKQEHTFFSDRFTGSLVAQSRRYVQSFADIADTLIFYFWLPLVHLVGVIGSLFFIQSSLAIIFLIWAAVYMGIVFWVTQRIIPYDTESAKQDSDLTARFSDILSNMFAVKTFATEHEEAQVFEQTIRRDGNARLQSWQINNVLIAIQSILFAFLEIGVMYLMIRSWLNGGVSTGTVVLVQVYIGSIFGELFGFGRAFGNFVKYVADASEMTDVFEQTPYKSFDTGIIHQESVAQHNDAVVFDAIGFRYPQGGQVFSNFSLTIRSGEKIGLVGSSGSGKSTLTKLLLKFIVPDQGVIRVGGKDISDISPQYLRRSIAYVPQDTALFHRSIAENIAYGRPGSSQLLIEDAARKAHAHEFIQALPEGYDTQVGERGVKLSGGERQRIAIARAILKNAPILVLDEATSALDTTSEHHIQEALHELMQGRTTIVIAHRLSTVREMDRILVLEDGRLAEEGSHVNLIAADGIYAGFWNRQTRSFGEAFIDEEEEYSEQK